MKRIIAFALALLLCTMMVACNEKTNHAGEVKTPSESYFMHGKGYQEVVAEFESRGFTNISTEIIADLNLDGLNNQGKVEKVTVGGEEYYPKDKWVPSDIEVVVFYHTLSWNKDGESKQQPGTANESQENDKTPTVENTPATQATTQNSVETIVQLPENNIFPDRSSFSVKFIDVGQGGSALVECDGCYMLIDGGKADNSSRMYSILKDNGISKLDLVVATNTDDSHIGGLSGALNYASANVTLCPVAEHGSKAFESLKKYAEKNGNGIKVPSVGDTYTLGSAVVSILCVNKGSPSENASMTLRVSYGKTSFLFAGNVGQDAERQMLDSKPRLSSNVLKVSGDYHINDTTEELLQAVMPAYAVISTEGASIVEDTISIALSEITNNNSTIFSTYQHGDIVFVSDGKSLSITTQKNDTVQQFEEYGFGTETKIEKDDAVMTEKADFVINISSKKFHIPSCSSVGKMKDSNKEFYVGARDDLVAKGYKPCSICAP